MLLFDQFVAVQLPAYLYYLKKCCGAQYTDMSRYQTIFFGLVALCVVLAAATQFWFYSRLESFCPGINLHLAPMVSGGCLVSSFVVNMGWIVSRRRQLTFLARLFLFVWVVVISVGLVATGATFGQSTLYSKVCPALVPSIVFGVDIVAVQIVSAVLLILSIAAPHVYKKKPVLKEDLLELTSAAAATLPTEFRYKPLIFINPDKSVDVPAI